MATLDIVRNPELGRGQVRFMLDGAEVSEDVFVEALNAGGTGHIEYSPQDEALVLSQVHRAMGRDQ
ncbi:hypothetical protein [Brevundimonas sp.]|uniref:hypothetical protein n=1 Tax=Brevundimonas sp. TaxID=1871086 RepID=UPI0035AE3B6E